MCCETQTAQRAALHAASFAATTQKPINIGVCVVKKKALAQMAEKRNLLTKHKAYKH